MKELSIKVFNNNWILSEINLPVTKNSTEKVKVGGLKFEIEVNVDESTYTIKTKKSRGVIYSKYTDKVPPTSETIPGFTNVTWAAYLYNTI